MVNPEMLLEKKSIKGHMIQNREEKKPGRMRLSEANFKISSLISKLKRLMLFSLLSKCIYAIKLQKNYESHEGQDEI